MCSEGIWRRTQEEGTQEQSNWKSPLDKRRRMIHFFDEYDVVGENGRCRLIIKNIYLWLCLTLPEQEIKEYLFRLNEQARKHGWGIDEHGFKKDAISINLNFSEHHPEDQKEHRVFPQGYCTLEATVESSRDFKPNGHSPWAILNSGIRKKGKRVPNPRVMENIHELLAYAPFQVELGGGASIELGVPPLNHLHTVYAVADPKTKKFIFGKEDYLLTDLLKDYETFYKEKASLAYGKSLLAQPNQLYQLLAVLHKKGLLVGNVITNNFDGLASLVGLQETYVRSYKDTAIVPKITFAENAKSLLVIGSHADRRLVQAAARRQGLKIIYVDPERYTDYFGRASEYPLETIEKEDILIAKTAGEFAQDLQHALSAPTV